MSIVSRPVAAGSDAFSWSHLLRAPSCETDEADLSQIPTLPDGVPLAPQSIVEEGMGEVFRWKFC